VLLLVFLPVVLFGVPAAFGHPAVTGDNLIQNLPLRALSGRQIREGHLPLWNPYIWSGSPLLGGLNAGSFYPFTFLFAVLPPLGAWVANLVVVYWAAGLSLYALARQYRLRPLASLLAALTYAFSGTMSGQLVHLGVVQGVAFMPLLVLSLLKLSWAVFGTGPVGEGEQVMPGPGDDGRAVAAPHAVGDPTARAAPWRSPWPWAALLAAVVGLEALTGEPRAIAETEVVAGAVVLWQLLRPYGGARGVGGRETQQVHASVGARDRLRYLAYAIIGGAWGVALAAGELAPGWSFIRASQRAVENYSFFGSGSLRPSWTLLMLVPDLFGGTGIFGQPRFFNSYNLPEVTGYVGLLPLGAALALLARSFGRRRSRHSADWGMWLALAGLGLLLSWGSFTPLGHIWAAIPLFGKTRLQSRNLAIVDLALAVLFAFFSDRLLAGSTEASEVRTWRRYLVAGPAVGAALVVVLTLAAPAPVEEWLHVNARGASLVRALWPWFVGEAAVAAGVVLLVWTWRRLRPRVRSRALVAVVLADVALFLLATSTAVAPARATIEPGTSAATAVLGSAGRFGFVDTFVSHLTTLTAIGQPDLNVFTRRQSVQGYGSILSNSYGDATGTHSLDSLSACALASGVFDQLRLSTLAVFPGDLVTLVGPTPDVTRGVTRRRVFPAAYPPTAHRATAAAAACRARAVAGTDSRRVLYLGWPVALRAVTVVLTGVPGTGAAEHRAPTVAVLGTSGREHTPAETVERRAKGWAVRFATPQLATGIVVLGAGAPVSQATTVTGASGTKWAFEGTMQDVLDTRAWRFEGSFAGVFGVFHTARPVRPPVWLAHRVEGSSVTQVKTTDWGSAVDRVVASRPVTVVWSESYMPGWHARLTPLRNPLGETPGGAGAAGTRGGPRRAVVERHGLVQAVRVPPGSWLLTFDYRPSVLNAGFAASLVAVLGFALLGAVVLVRRRRARLSRAGTEASARRAGARREGRVTVA